MSDPDPEMTVVVAPIDESLLSYTHVMYALHSLAVLIAVTTFHTIVGSFIGSLPSIVAVVMNYVRRSATRGTFLESHFRWQLRTFWFAVLWACVSGLVMLTIIGIPAGLLGLLALAIWILYHPVHGWPPLHAKNAMPVLTRQARPSPAGPPLFLRGSARRAAPHTPAIQPHRLQF